MPLPFLHGLHRTAAGNSQTAGHVRLLAIRQWATARRDVRKDDAPVSLRGVMAAVMRRAGNPAVSGDATDIADSARGNHDRLAEKVFRDTLLSVPGGEFALGPLDGPGAVLSHACLFLTGREMPRDSA